MIGKPVNRVDGPAKVTGRATYAYEYQHEDKQLYGVIVTATIGRGRIREIDLSQAKRLRARSPYSRQCKDQPLRRGGSSGCRHDAGTGAGRGPTRAHPVRDRTGSLRFRRRPRTSICAQGTALRDANRQCGGKFRRGVRRRPRQGRLPLQDVLLLLAAYGDEHLRRSAAWRWPGPLHEHPNCRRGACLRGYHAEDGSAEDQDLEPLRGRWVWIQAGHSLRDHSGRDGGASPGSPREGRTHATADLPRRGRAAHVHPADSTGCGTGRQAHRARSRRDHAHEPRG